MIDDFKRPPVRRPVRLDTLGHSIAEPAILPGYAPVQPFQTPEQVAGQEASAAEPAVFPPANQAVIAPQHRFHIGSWQPTKKQLVIISAAILLIGGSAAAYTLTRSAPTTPKVHAAVVVPVQPPPPKPILSGLTGLPVTAEQQALPVTAAMIENSPDARPQSGLKDAGVVYEAIAEGGITRFMALYQESQPANIGPIRSSRPYYLQWLLPFDAGYAHVGGSPDALAAIKSLGVRDLDQFYNSGSYHRISTRYAPHNVYTGVDKLVALEKAKGFGTSTFTGFVRKAEAPYKAPAQPAAGTATSTKTSQDSRQPVTSIDFAMSGTYYNVHYDYDPAANAYKRSEGGAAHIDFDSKAQLEPKVVVALSMPYSLMSDGYHSVYNTTGNGPMSVFQDGTAVSGTWAKADAKSQFTFTGSDGKPLALNPGQTWITILKTPTDAHYK